MRRISFGLVVLLAASIPLEGIGSVGSLFKLPRLAAMAALGGVLLSICAGARIRPLDRVVGWAAAFTAWVGLSYFWSIDPDVTLTRALTLLQLLVLVWVVWQEATTEERCLILMKAYVAGAAVACAVSLARGSDRFIERFALGDPNTFGVLTVIAVAMAAYIVHREPRSRWGLACRPFTVVAAVAVVLTASRTATVALAMVCVVLLVDRRTVSFGRLGLLAVAFVGFLVIAGRVVDSAQIERIQSLEAEVTEGTLGGRLPLWRLAWDRFTDRPITGIGASTFRLEAEQSLGRGRAPHSTFVGVLVELGTVGFVLFLTVLVCAAGSAARLPTALVRMWVAAALAWTIASFSLSWETKKITWFLVVLVAAQAAARREGSLEDRAADRRPAPAP